jgi:hypothetical protein
VLTTVEPLPEKSIGIAFDVDAGEWSVGHNGASSLVPEGLEGPEFVAVVGSVIELSVPLSLLDNPSGFTQVQAEALTTSAELLDRMGPFCAAN